MATMYQLLAVVFIVFMLTFYRKETRLGEHVYCLVVTSLLFHMDGHLLRESDCSLDLSNIAGEMNSTITSTLESTAMTVISLKENGTCIIETICDPRVINDESMVVKCTNLTFCERNESNDEYIPLNLKVIDEPTRKKIPYPRLRCALTFFDETIKLYSINTTMALKDSEGNVEILEFVRLRRESDDTRSTIRSFLFKMLKILRHKLPLHTIAFYVPFVLTFFFPTQITQDGLKLINLEGASPVSVRSAVGNYFIPRESDEGISWAEIVIIVCLRILVLCLFIEADPSLSFFRSVACACYVVESFNFFRALRHILFSGERRIAERRACKICDCTGNYQERLECQNLSLPERISFHLRKQPYIFLLFCSHSYEHLKELCVQFSNFPPTFRGILRFFVSLFCSFLCTIFGILHELWKVFNNLYLTSPLHTMLITLNAYFVRDQVFYYAGMEALIILLLTTEFVHGLIMLAFPILLQEENLPYFFCFCLSCYYSMENYSAFTKKYQNLGWILFEEYDQPTAVTNRFSPVVIIPQELFYRACEELMPIRNSVCELVFGLIISLAPVYIVFFQAEVPKDHIMSGLKTFLMSLFPKIILSFQLTLHKKIKTAETKFKVKKIIADWNIVRAQHPHRD